MQQCHEISELTSFRWGIFSDSALSDTAQKLGKLQHYRIQSIGLSKQSVPMGNFFLRNDKINMTKQFWLRAVPVTSRSVWLNQSFLSNVSEIVFFNSWPRLKFLLLIISIKSTIYLYNDVCLHTKFHWLSSDWNYKKLNFMSFRISIPLCCFVTLSKCFINRLSLLYRVINPSWPACWPSGSPPPPTSILFFISNQLIW